MIIYHYTYLITNIQQQKHYIGSRSCKILPINDIGIKYFSSSYNKEFILDQQLNPTNYQYQILEIFNDRKSALEMEISLHEYFDVGKNESFYNMVKQTSIGFDSTGMKMSDSQRHTIRQKKLGSILSEETKNKISKKLSGRKYGIEYGLARSKPHKKSSNHDWHAIDVFYQNNSWRETLKHFKISYKTLTRGINENLVKKKKST